MFLDAQLLQIEKWLLEPKMYAVVIGLSLLSIIFGVERLDQKYWLRTAVDYFYGVMYTLVYFPIIVVCLALIKGLTDTYMPWMNLGLASEMPVVVAFMVVVLVDDFLAYFSHYIRHKIQPLWYFHIIHHSQPNLNPLTTKRFHPLENLFNKAAISWIPLAVLGISLEMWVIYYLIDAVWDYFIHSNLRINLGPLRHVFVSPQYHRIHHSRLDQHFDKNFSDRLVIWDVLFGTAYLKADEYPPTGVKGVDIPVEEGWSPLALIKVYCRQMLYPFVQIYRDLASASARPSL